MAIVLGGGLSGLSAGYYLRKKFSPSSLKLILVEASERCGGWVDTTDNPGFIFESGPRTIRPKGVPGINTLNLIEELGLTEKVLPILPDSTAAKNRMIYAKKKLHLLPSTLLGALLVKEPFTKPLASAFLHDLKSKAKYNLTDDTMYNFVERRFGRELADYAISPMLCGICAGDAKEISVKFLLSSLFEMEQKHGGVVKGLIKSAFSKSKPDDIDFSNLAKKAKEEKWSIYSLNGGLETLPISLRESVQQTGGTICTDHKVEEIKFYKDNKKVCVKIKDKYAFCAQHLISSIPAFELAPLVRNQHPKLADELRNIPFVNVAVVNLQYNSKELLKHDAFGFLVPPAEKLPILGVIFDSCCFPNQKGTVLTAMMGGKWFKQYFGENPTEEFVLNIALSQVKDILGIDVQPDTFKVNILNKCIPQYVVGHHNRVNRIRQYINDNQLPISLCGSSYDGVGVNDVILSARKATENVCLS